MSTLILAGATEEPPRSSHELQRRKMDLMATGESLLGGSVKALRYNRRRDE
jgi:hypothetical protein